MHNLKTETSDFNVYSSDKRAIIFYEYSCPELLGKVTFRLF